MAVRVTRTRSERPLPADFVKKLTFARAEMSVLNSAQAPFLSGFAHLLRRRKDLGWFAEILDGGGEEECGVNLGWTSLAAPNAVSSSVSRYSRTARPASAGLMVDASHSSFGVEFCLFASASIRLASTAMRCPLARPRSMQRATVVPNKCRRSSLSRNAPQYGN